MRKKTILTSATVLLLLLCYKGNSQINELKSWLAQNEAVRQPLTDLNFSQLPLTKAEAEEVKSLLITDKQNSILSKHGQEWDSREIKLGNLSMPFFYQNFGQEPEDGRSLFISMHGGGATAPSVNDGQYENQKILYNATMANLEGVYLAARAPTNTWNLWHQNHIDDFFNVIIQLAILKENVNPNKIYLLGYSAGGDGVYQLAPRMADRWAAASMMAGHPNEATPVNLRNTPFTIHMGGNDSSFNRNGIAVEWGNQLGALQNADPNGYIHDVNIYEGLGHWMQLRDAVALPWMKNYLRNPIPEKVVWKQDDRHHNSFYWLKTPANNIQTGGKVVAEYNKANNEINILENYSSEIQILVNDDMLNLDSPITVKYQNNTIHQGMFYRTILSAQESLLEKGDSNFTFPSTITVKDNQVIEQNNVTLSTNNIDINKVVVNLYPNPVKDNLTVFLPKQYTNATTIKIYNLQGQVLKTVKTNTQKNSINLSQLSNSVLIVTISNNTNTTTHKIIKK